MIWCGTVQSSWIIKGVWHQAPLMNKWVTHMVAFEQNTPPLLLVDLDFEESFNLLWFVGIFNIVLWCIFKVSRSHVSFFLRFRPGCFHENKFCESRLCINAYIAVEACGGNLSCLGTKYRVKYSFKEALKNCQIREPPPDLKHSRSKEWS